MKNKTTLHLILKRQWFDLIANGEKKEEYREIKQYWWRQFCRRPTARDFVKSDIIPNKYKFITFHNGYTNDKLTFTCEGISIGKGKKEWGAPTDKEVFIIHIGERIIEFHLPKNSVGGSYEEVM